MKAICITIVFSVITFLNPMFSQVLNVTPSEQEQSQWCWAGSSSCILNYYCAVTSQCIIAEYTRNVATWHNFGTSNCCTNPNAGCNYWNYNYGYAGSIQDILIHFANIPNSGYSFFLTTSSVHNEISANRPFVIRWGWTTGGGHFLVGHGLVNTDLYYMDPWYGEGLKIASYSWVVSGSNHNWTHTNVLGTSSPRPFPANPITGLQSVCSGQTPLVYSTSPIQNATSYLWNISPSTAGVIASNGTTATVTLADSFTGTFNITVNGQNSCGLGAISSPLVVTVKSRPAITSTTPGSRCGAGVVTIGANATGGALNWYATSSGGSSLGSGCSFLTPSISETSTFYVDASENGCTSTPRTSVTATVLTPPLQPSIISGPSILCKNTLDNCYSVSNALGVTYSWSYNGYGFSILSGQGTNNIMVSYSNNATSGTLTVVPSDSCAAGEARQLEISLPMLLASPEIQTVSSEAGNNVNLFNIFSNTSWIVSNDQQWCDVTQTSFSGNGSITATYLPNNSPTSRSTNITISFSCNSHAYVTLVQAGKSDKILNLTLLLEGLYYNDAMAKTQDSWGYHFPDSIAEEISLELHNSISPFNQVGPAYPVMLNMDGTAKAYIPADLNNSYYLVVKNRNHISTWSAYPLQFDQDTIVYDFTDHIEKAYGNNLKIISSKCCTYAGDVNQDGVVDAMDMINIDNHSKSMEKGYFAEDINGDGLINMNDMSVVENNANDFIGTLSPTESVLPVINTTNANSISTISAISGGQVVSNGSSVVSARGVCWSTYQNPTINNNHTIDGSGTGIFESNISGLFSNTTYFFRAYATNSYGTSYGNELSFNTMNWLCGSDLTINHIAGSVAPVTKTATYGTVDGIPGTPTKCWLTSNLGSDHQAASVNDATEASAGWYWQFNHKQGFKHDGTTRTPNTNWIGYISQSSDWTGSNDPCMIELGNGWRIPTNTEWQNVTTLAGWTNWNGPWNSDLKLHAAGKLPGLNGGALNSRGSRGQYWSNMQLVNSYARSMNFSCDFISNSEEKASASSIRCLRSTVPYITTTYASNINITNATSGGTISPGTGSAIHTRGVCWSLLPNPTLTESHTSDGSGTGSYNSSITQLSPNTNYFVRSYAINETDTMYGNQVNFTSLLNPCPGLPNFTDTRDGQVYNTVQVGTQCWMRENLNFNAPSSLGIKPVWYYNENDTTYGQIYGKLYEKGFSNAYCPDGWHSPYTYEWDQLISFLGGVSVAGGKIKSTGISESGTGLWNSPNSSATNESGLTLLPAGNVYFENSPISSPLGTEASFFTNYLNQIGQVESIVSKNNSGELSRNYNTFNYYARSVRCIKNCNPTAQSPAQGIHISGQNSILWKWQSVAGAVSYKVWVPNYPPSTAIDVGMDTCYLQTGLVCNHAYSLNVQAYNACGPSIPSLFSAVTSLCWVCGDSLSVNHSTTGGVAPANKTTKYGTITNIPGEPSKCWISSNLGADHQASSVSDASEASAGWYWQFNQKQGYKHDGVNLTPNSSWINLINENSSWLATNDPCSIELGSGWRIPTMTEWTNVEASGCWLNWDGPWNSLLKLHAAGSIYVTGNTLEFRGSKGYQWGSTQNNNTFSSFLLYSIGQSEIVSASKLYGFSVRCLK